jgi:hypothetical protein
MNSLPSTPGTQTSTQTWAAIATAVAGAVAVFAKKRLTRPRAPSVSQHSFDALAAKLDANHKEIVAAIATQSGAIEKRLDALEAAVARLDERTAPLKAA